MELVFIKVGIIALTFELVRLKEMYELGADDLVKSIIGDIYEARTMLDSVTATKRPVSNPNTTSLNKNTDKLSRRNRVKFKNNINKANATNSFATNKTTIHAERKVINISLREIKLRQEDRYIENKLQDNSTKVPNFIIGADDPGQITSKFDSIARQLKPEKTIYKYNTSDALDPTAPWKRAKIVTLMQQFVYEVRYLIPVAQFLRHKYVHNITFKMGYCFALLHHLKSEQHILYSNMKVYHKGRQDIYLQLKQYERLVRLDVDMRDVMKYIMKLNYDKNMASNPNFYEYSLEGDSEYYNG